MESQAVEATPKVFRSAHRWAHIAPGKVRPIAELVRLKTVPEVIEMLGAMKQRGAALLRKVVQTALANAQDEDADTEPEDFHVAEVRIDDGPAMKRVRFRAMGRAARYKRRTCHISVIISDTRKK